MTTKPRRFVILWAECDRLMVDALRRYSNGIVEHLKWAAGDTMRDAGGIVASYVLTPSLESIQTISAAPMHGTRPFFLTAWELALNAWPASCN